MSDNLTIQGFHRLFTYTMCEVSQDTYDIPPTLLFLGFGFVLCIFFLNVWFDNRKMMQSLQTESRLLRKEVGNLQKNMTI